MYFLERASSARRVGLWSVLGLILVPIVVAAGFLWATWDSSTRLDRVQAAVVNLDDPVQLEGTTVPLGRQLAGGLVTADPEQNFDWVLTDEADAAAGLRSGRYAAVVTIPQSFSVRATSFSRTGADSIEAATLQVQTSPVSGIADPVVGQAITAAATRALNSSLTQQYLQNIYVGFNDLGRQFASVADASAELAGGTKQVATGIDGVSTGTGELATGLGKLDDGAQQLAGGAEGVSSGATALTQGLDKLADGAAALPAGTRTLATGAARSAEGADTLAEGADRLAAGVKSLRTGTADQPGGTQALAAGAQQYAAGVATYRDSVGAIGRLSDAALVQRFPRLCPAPATLVQCAPVLQGFRAGITVALAGFDGSEAQPGLIGGAKQLAAGVAGVDGGVAALSGGAAGVAAGADRLADGLDQLASGTDRLADGTKPLADGLSSSASGAHQLADGAAQLSTGAGALATGTAQSASGAADLASGARELADAGSQLADGSQKLADGLAKGADAVPTYDQPTRQKLSEVVTTPVQSPAPTSAFSNVTTTTFLAVLALWVGALATYLVLRAVTSRVLASMKPSWRLSLEGLLPGALIGVVQAVALTVVLQLLLELPAGRGARLGAFALLTAVTFAAVNHALVAWFGGAGRFASVVLVVVGAAGALTSAVPASFDVLRPFLPLTPALDGFRAIAGGGSGTGAAVTQLTAWLLVGLVAGVLAVSRRRVVPAPAVVPSTG
ncbi:MAG: YhgE/Pip family protein [Friedmanniella sp.]